MNLREIGEKLLRQHYHRSQGWQWVLYEDFVPPTQLRGVEWVDRCFDRWFRELFLYQTPAGWIPVGGNPQPNQYFCVQDLSRMQPLRVIYAVAELVTWHNKPDELQRAREFAKQVFAAHKFSQAGWFTGIDAHTGVPCSDAHNVTFYGLLYRGLFKLGLHEECKQVLDVILSYVQAHSYALPERWTAYGPIDGDYSSDGAYFIRELEPSAVKRDFATFYSQEYFRPQYGHSVTHVNGDAWYSDGVVNQLIMHLAADRLDRFDQCWRTLQRESIQGLAPEYLIRGKGNGKPHANQELILEALVARAEQTGIAGDMHDARRFAELLHNTQAYGKPEVFGRHILALSVLL